VVRYNLPLPATRQLGPFPALGLWAASCLAIVLYTAWQGFGPGYAGRDFAATLTVFVFFLGVMLLLAARGVSDSLASRFGPGGGLFLGATVLLGYLIYALGTNTFAIGRAAAAVALVFVPLVLGVSAESKPPGAWQDYVTLIGIWIAVKFSPAQWLWPYPGGRTAHVLMILFVLNVALACFLMVRRVNATGYSLGWGRRWGLYILGSFIVFGCIAIPLGTALHFIQFAPRWAEWKSVPFLALAIFFFTAWPEELLFRGLLQNMLSRSCKNDFAGWWMASLLFGFSHITNLHFPNWRYVLLASIAGFFYGWTWRKSGSIFASAIVHALVDVTWHFLFRTL
jgi:membrane protease YdiL (CAAX protease family)